MRAHAVRLVDYVTFENVEEQYYLRKEKEQDLDRSELSNCWELPLPGTSGNLPTTPPPLGRGRKDVECGYDGRDSRIQYSPIHPCIMEYLGAMVERTDGSRLLKDEVAYELTIRGLPTEGSAAELRGRLAQAIKGGVDIVPSAIRSLDPQEELSICGDKAKNLSEFVRAMEDTWSSADVRRVEARRWHLLKRLTALQGDQHQMDQRDHLLEAVCLLGDEIQAVKGALRKNPGPPGSPSPSSPLPEVSETDQGEGSLPEPAISRLPYYGLAATPPLVRFQCSSKGDARFSVSAEDIAGQFLESNAYLRSMHTDHRTMMAKGMFLATPQEAKIKDFTTEAASKVTTAVGLSTSEISQLNNRFGEFITVLGALQREQLSIKKGVDAIHLQFGHLRDKMDRLSLSQQGELADLRRGMQGLAAQLETLRTQAPLPTPTVHSMAAAAHRQNRTAWAPPAGEVLSGHGVLEQPFPPPPPHSPAPSNIHGPSSNFGYRDMVASVGKAISQIAWYSGDSKVGSAESWVAQIRSLKQLKELGGERIPESIWVQAAVSRGQGEAILFLQKNQTSLKTLDELEAALRRRFEGIRTELSYIQDLERAFMAKGESVTQYGERVKALAERADPAKHPDQNMVALQAFMRGLPDGIAVSTAQMNPQSITEAMNKAQAALSMCEALKTKARPAALHEQPLTTAAIRSQSRPSSPQHGEQRRIGYGRRSASPPFRHKKGSPPPHEKRKSWSYNWNRPFRSDVYCNLCRVKGHWGRECAYRLGGAKYVGCPKRGKGGKVKLNSLNHPPLITQTANDHGSGKGTSINNAPATKLQQEHLETTTFTVGMVSPFTLQGQIESTKGTCLIDTGSQITLVARSAVPASKWRPSSRRVQGVTGAPLNIYGDALCAIHLPGSPAFTALASVADLPNGLVAIIGLDVQKQQGAVINVVTGQVLFQKPQQSLPLSGHWDRDYTAYMVASRYVAIPPNTVAAVPVRRKGITCSPQKLQLLCPVETEGARIALSAHDNSDHSVVMVCNCTDHVVEFKNNSKMGHLQEIDLPVPSDVTVAATLADSAPHSSHTQSSKERQAFLSFLQAQAQGFEHWHELVDRLAPYVDVFSFPGFEKLGATSVVEHSIPTGDHKPVRTRQYKTPVKQKEIMERIVQEHLTEGIIRPGTGAWQSPCLLVPKRTLIDGETKLSWRMVVDFRKLNKITTPEFFPLPRVQECLDQMAGSQYFTTLDLRSGYHQVKIKEEDIEKTGFATHDGVWCFERMPFGLSNAPATFQRMAASLVKSLGSGRALAFLDDLVLFHESWEQQLDELCDLLQLFRQADLKLQLQKCHFLQKQVHYLGHIVSAEGIQPDDRKLEAVRNYPVPTSVKHFRAFVGLCSYYRRFVKSFASIAHPLTHLTKKDVHFQWGPEQQLAFETLKERLTSPPILAYPDFTSSFILATDASGCGVGAVLSQLHDGKEHPVAYASRALNKAEMNYSATELELLAIVYAVNYFHQYLWGSHFTIITDHAALRYLHQMKDSNSRIMRWSLLLEEYAYTPKYKKGTINSNADGLSRAFAVVETLSSDQFIAQQAQDSFCNRVKNTPKYCNTGDGVLAKHTRQGLRIVVPSSLRLKVLALNHSTPQGGHCGHRKTYQAASSKYFWPGMAKDVASFVRRCPQCALVKDHGRVKPPMGKFNDPKQAFEAISIDIVGPLPPTPDGFKYILTVIDQFSRFVQFYALKTQTAEEIAQKLVAHFCRFGTSKRLLSDQGRNLTSELVRHLCEFFQVDKVQTTAYHPAGNGRCERVHRTMARLLAHFVNDNQTDWEAKLPLAELVINSHVNETTTYPPFTVVFGRDMPTPARDDLTLSPSIEPYALQVEELRETLKQLWEEVDRMHTLHSSRAKDRHDRSRNAPSFAVRDMVYLYTPAVKKGKTKKFNKFWAGPYKIVKVHSDQNVTLKMEYNNSEGGNSKLTRHTTSHRVDRFATNGDQRRNTLSKRLDVGKIKKK
ncbi:unnamed protein product [Nesidiocoris tenuis]|uniref:RNA-directed DNA polymerase n=2 Tax=Nesidiocoris tenuis TaxID=355587 RepID=A0A6H5HFX8_9HEMI|nr:unnamed protein product [Nesidiocoris tenuis]